jgi:hypothetical protein
MKQVSGTLVEKSLAEVFMKRMIMAVLCLSASAFAQSTISPAAASQLASGGAECLPCLEAAQKRQQIKDFNRIIDATKAPKGIETRSVIQEIAQEIDVADEEVAQKDATAAARKKRFAVAISNVDTFDQLTAEELVRALRVKGMQTSGNVDIYILREQDQARKSEVLARFRKALTLALQPVVKEVRNTIKGEKAVQKSASPLTEDQDPKEATKEESKVYALSSKVAETFRVSGSEVTYQIYGNDDPQTTRYLGVSKGKGAKPRLEARYSSVHNGKLNYGVAANLSKNNGRNEFSAFFYIGGKLDANFNLTK